MILLVWLVMMCCWNGPAGNQTPGQLSICHALDYDGDFDVDLLDYADWSNELQGPDRPVLE